MNIHLFSCFASCSQPFPLCGRGEWRRGVCGGGVGEGGVRGEGGGLQALGGEDRPTRSGGGMGRGERCMGEDGGGMGRSLGCNDAVQHMQCGTVHTCTWRNVWTGRQTSQMCAFMYPFDLPFCCTCWLLPSCQVVSFLRWNSKKKLLEHFFRPDFSTGEVALARYANFAAFMRLSYMI